MDMLLNWLNAPLSEPNQSAMEQLLKAYRREMMMERVVDKVGDHFLPDENKELDHQDKLLGIALKRRQLGYPMNDDDLENALNEGGGFPLSGLAIGALGAGLGSLARPGLGKAAAKATDSIGQFFNRTVAHEAPRGPLYPGAKPASIAEHGAHDITRLMGRVFQFRQP